jgi:alpha-galactosidase
MDSKHGKLFSPKKNHRGRCNRLLASGAPRLVYQAICFDPLTSAVLSLAEIEKMVNQMLKQNKPYLPQFKRFKV